MVAFFLASFCLLLANSVSWRFFFFFFPYTGLGWKSCKVCRGLGSYLHLGPWTFLLIEIFGSKSICTNWKVRNSFTDTVYPDNFIDNFIAYGLQVLVASISSNIYKWLLRTHYMSVTDAWPMTVLDVFKNYLNFLKSLKKPPVFSFTLGTPSLNLFYTAAAAAKSLQSCLTLCHPIDGNPPSSPIPGILQARTLEWVAFSFSNAWKWKVNSTLISQNLWKIQVVSLSYLF